MNVTGPDPAESQRMSVYSNRFMHESEWISFIDRIESFPSITISSRGWSDIALLAQGAYAPLRGFVGETDYRSIVATGHLSNGVPFEIPLILPVDEEDADEVEIHHDVVLRDRDGRNIALMHLSEKFRIDTEELSDRIVKSGGPGSARMESLTDEGDFALAGSIDILRIENRGGLRDPVDGISSGPGGTTSGRNRVEII